MQTLINAYAAALVGPKAAAHNLRIAFEGLTLKEKLVIILGPEGALFDDVLHYDSDYTGGSHREVSLYDDFCWDRGETKDLSDIVESVLDDLEEYTSDETAEELTEIILNGGGPKAATLLDMVSKNVGKACHDW